MSWNASWMRVLRTVVVTGLLVLALLGAVLGAIGTTGHPAGWAHGAGAGGAETAPPHAPGTMEYRIGGVPDGRYRP